METVNAQTSLSIHAVWFYYLMLIISLNIFYSNIVLYAT